MKQAHLFTILLILLPIVVVPITEAANAKWSYGNYLYDFVILALDDPMEAGQTGSINVKVCAKTEVTVHVEFKGHYHWGEWIYDSKEIQLDPGESEFTTELEIPFKTIVEPTCDFYYYVYVTLPEEEWSSHCWGLAPDVNVTLPSEVSLNDLHEMMSHISWMIKSSELSDIVKSLLVSRIERLAMRLDVLYYEGEFTRIYEILELFLKIKERICSDTKEHSDYWFEIIDHCKDM